MRGIPKATLKMTLMSPVGDYMCTDDVRDFWLYLPSADALTVLWELPQTVESALPM